MARTAPTVSSTRASWGTMPEQLLLWPDHDPAPALSVWERLGMWMVGECEWPAEAGPEPRWWETESEEC